MRRTNDIWCIFLRSLPVGGVERQFTTLVNLLSKKRKVYLVTLFKADVDAACLVDDCVERIHLFDQVDPGITPLHVLLRAPKRLKALCSEHEIDVLYSARDVANLVAALASLSLQNVRLLWGHRSSMHKPSLRIRVLFPFLRMVRGGVACEISNNWEGIEYYRKMGLCSGEVARVVNFLDQSLFRICPERRVALRKEWSLPEDAIAVGIVGRIAAMKNQDGFLRVVRRVAPSYPSVHFYVIGPMDNAVQQRLQQQVDDAGLTKQLRIIPGVPMTEMPGVFNALDVLCSTSLYGEGFCNTMAEAMASGCVVVGTDVGAAREIVGEAGAVVPPGDDELYEEMLRRTLERVGAWPSVESRSHILSICDDDLTLKRIIEIGEA